MLQYIERKTGNFSVIDAFESAVNKQHLVMGRFNRWMRDQGEAIELHDFPMAHEFLRQNEKQYCGIAILHVSLAYIALNFLLLL